MAAKTVVLTNLNVDGTREFVETLGEPGYRAKQLRNWIYQRLALSFEEMTDLPLSLRQKLSREARLHGLSPLEERNGRDGTVKILFALTDGKTIEAALMDYHGGHSRERHTVCVSTQVGCPVDCPFCATGQQGFERNLTSGEIVSQVLYLARRRRDGLEKPGNNISGKISPVTNVVFMGMGEPLANYNALIQAVDTLNSPDALGLGARNMVVSTAGLVPQINRLGREKFQLGLAVSLHAPDNTLRNRLVPINRKYPLEQLIPACQRYFETTGRRVSFEYILFDGINDAPGQARSLAELLRGMNCHVNIIPANPTDNNIFKPPPERRVYAFVSELKRGGINATLRRSRGQDIGAGCGQLRSRFLAGSAMTGKEDG